MATFITFEGIEGCGKTTQIRQLAGRLRGRGLDVVQTREPGGCPIADQIRTVLLDAGNRAMDARTELLLYAAARAQHVAEVIRPALRAGRIVLCDRYTDATIAYQGYGRRLDRGLIDLLNRVAADELVPHLTLLLDFPPEEGLKRARRRNANHVGDNEDRFEQEALDFHRRVRQGYLDLAQADGRFRIVDAAGSVEEIARRIDAVVSHFLAAETEA